MIRQMSSNRYVDAYQSNVNNRDYRLVTRDGRKDGTQRWLLTPLGNNAYTIQQVSSNRYVDAYQSNVNNRDYRLVTRDWQNDDTQRWVIAPS